MITLKVLCQAGKILWQVNDVPETNGPFPPLKKKKKKKKK